MTSRVPDHPRRLLAALGVLTLGAPALTLLTTGPATAADHLAHHTRPAAAAHRSPHHPAAIVAMGDSLAAGEGGGDYAPGRPPFGQWCHRSPHSHIPQAKPAGVTVAVNLACSAATTDDIRLGGTSRYGEPAQAEQLKAVARDYDVHTIVLTVGANDISTVAMTIDCTLAQFRPGPPCSHLWNWLLPRRLADIEPRIVADLHDIRTVMSAAGYRDGAYDLILQSYTSPSGGLSRYAGARRVLEGCPFRDEDIAWFHDVGFPTITRYMGEAAASVPGVRFLGLTAALDGRQVCMPGIDHRAELMWGLFLDVSSLPQGPGPQLVSQSLHPNAAGYRSLAWCLRRFHTFPATRAECVRSADGRLRLIAGTPASPALVPTRAARQGRDRPGVELLPRRPRPPAG